jgi:hypothetical protein
MGEGTTVQDVNLTGNGGSLPRAVGLRLLALVVPPILALSLSAATAAPRASALDFGLASA